MHDICAFTRVPSQQFFLLLRQVQQAKSDILKKVINNCLAMARHTHQGCIMCCCQRFITQVIPAAKSSHLTPTSSLFLKHLNHDKYDLLPQPASVPHNSDLVYWGQNWLFFLANHYMLLHTFAESFASSSQTTLSNTGSIKSSLRDTLKTQKYELYIADDGALRRGRRLAQHGPSVGAAASASAEFTSNTARVSPFIVPLHWQCLLPMHISRKWFQRQQQFVGCHTLATYLTDVIGKYVWRTRILLHYICTLFAKLSLNSFDTLNFTSRFSAKTKGNLKIR